MKNGQNEIWKDVVGYEGIYQVSSCGNVRSLTRTTLDKPGYNRFIKGRVLKQTGIVYRMVHLSKNNIGKPTLVHRLVAIAFIPNPENKRCVNHKDCNKQNNHAFNLEWVTDKENNQHAILNGHVKSPIWFTKKVLDTESGIVYPSVKAAALEFGINHNVLCNMLNTNNHQKNKTSLVYAQG